MGRAGRRLLLLLGASFAVISLVVGALALVALRHPPGNPAEAVPDPTAPGQAPSYAQGWWQRHSNPDDGYTLALPPDWQVLPSDPDGLARYTAEHTGDEACLAERLATWAGERKAAGEGLWAAVAPDGVLGDVATINILRQPLGRPLPVEAFARANRAELARSRELASATQDWLQTSAGPILRTQALCSPAGAPPTRQTYSVTQFYLVCGPDGYVVTGVARSDRAGDYTPVFEAIVRSLRWTLDGPKPGKAA